MLTYILNNGMLAAGTFDHKVFYAGQWFEINENPMDGSYSFDDATGEPLEVVGMMEEIDNRTVAIYAADEVEYDLVREHISINPDDEYNTYHVFNEIVFFGADPDGFDFTYYGTYNSDGSILDFSDLASAEEWANSQTN